MIPRLLPLVPLALAAPLLISARPLEPMAEPLAGTQWAQVAIHERIIIRIQRSAPPIGGRAAAIAETRPPAIVWKERKAPRCVATQTITGARLGGDGEVDLIVEGVKRLRARLDADCPTLDFYSGLYLKPTADGKICARRDAIRSRSGASCAIGAFRQLVPKR